MNAHPNLTRKTPDSHLLNTNNGVYRKPGVIQVLVLSQQDWEYLDSYGDWLERLESGRILPTTERQVQFLAVMRGEREPQHPEEHLWLKVKAVRESVSESVLLKITELERDELTDRLAYQSALVVNLRTEIDAKKEISTGKKT